MSPHFILLLFLLAPFSSSAAIHYNCTLGIYKKKQVAPLSEQTLNYKHEDPKNTLQVKLHGFEAIVENTHKNFKCPPDFECEAPEAGLVLILQHKGLRAQTVMNLNLAKNHLFLASKDMMARLICSQQPSKVPVTEAPYSLEN